MKCINYIQTSHKPLNNITEYKKIKISVYNAYTPKYLNYISSDCVRERLASSSKKQ